MEKFTSACSYLKIAQPSDPVICHRPHAAARSARWFLEYFPGEVLYAVKANSSPLIISSLYAAGIRHFDVCSPAEMRLLSRYSDIRMYYMNPVKHPEHIRSAYIDYGVQDFSLDTLDELNKISAATNNAKDLSLHVRISVDNSSALLPLDLKFGACAVTAPPLLMAARLRAESLDRKSVV